MFDLGVHIPTERSEISELGNSLAFEGLYVTEYFLSGELSWEALF
jgi:hypothetical protein